MPCVAGVHCKIPSHTPGPPSYTIHMCRKCDGYLHGICGETDPDGGNNDCKRVCEGQQCLSVLVQPQQQHQRKGSGGNTMSPPPSTLRSLNLSSAVGSSAGRCSQNGDSLSKKPAFSGGQKRANLSLNTKLDVLNHLHQKKLKVAAVAEIFKIAARTVRQIKADEEKIRGKIESRPGAGNAKSSKGFKFPPHQHDGGVGRASRQGEQQKQQKYARKSIANQPASEEERELFVGLDAVAMLNQIHQVEGCNMDKVLELMKSAESIQIAKAIQSTSGNDWRAKQIERLLALREKSAVEAACTSSR